MKKVLKRAVGFAMAGVMTVAPVMTANAESWKSNAIGWWVERDDGSYLVNQWYQWPVNGAWYYMGADGYMLTNATTPDGYYVDGSGVWNQGANTGSQQVAASTKDVAAVRQVAEAYKAQNLYSVDSYVFCDIDSDGIPECIATNGDRWYALTHRGEKVTYLSEAYGGKPFYVPGKNVLCKYSYRERNDKIESEARTFYEINDDGRFVNIGESSLSSGVIYRTPTRSDTSKAIYDDYNNSFGQLTEISIEYEDTYRSIDEACEAYLAQ